MNKKLIKVVALLASTSLLSSCGSSEKVKEYQIVTDCSSVVCSVVVDDVDLLRYTNVLGKYVDQVLKSEPLGAAEGTQFDVTWNISGGDYASAQQMLDAGLTACENDVCLDTANPTGYVFDSVESKEISVSGSIVNPDGTTQEISLTKTFTVEYGAPKIASEVISGLNYHFTADITDTGIPDNATFTWKVNGTEIGTGQEINYFFPVANTTYTVTLEVSLDGKVIATSTEDVITGNAISVLYEVPNGTTKTAEEIAVEFVGYSGDKKNVATVAAEGGKLRFTCETGYHVTQEMVDLAPDRVVRISGVTGSSGTVMYSDSSWSSGVTYAAMNNAYNSTGIGCIAD
ncbi:DUF3281 family protein [Allofrancisella frigidaquae]|uniref:DUF3281 domain-containing protein n=1 Tax=Allofrancisella frigidaquae TaxID=1085644 RepID=A0A6M3HUR2_9GAMM|nr:DUF3281 family protein [Allofrancisella frigidaquae]QIV94770.1 DUF3281 domain-containing protein [Allofrancisella frigidaquae]